LNHTRRLTAHSVIKRTYLVRNNTLVFSCGKVSNEDSFATEIADLAKLQSHLWKVILSHDIQIKKSTKARNTSHSLMKLARLIADRLNDVSDYIPDLDVTTISTKVLVKHGVPTSKSAEKEPLKIIDLLSVQKLSYLGDVVISDGVAVDTDPSGDFVEVTAHLDEVQTSALLAKDLNAQGLIVLDKTLCLTDRHIFLNKDTNLDDLVAKHIGGNKWDATHKRKLRSVFECVQSSQGWAVIGSEEHGVRSLLELQEGTFVGYYNQAPSNAIPPPVKYDHVVSPKFSTNIESWSVSEAAKWLESELHINKDTVAKLKLTGKELLRAEPRHLRALGLDMMTSHYISTEAFALRHENPNFRLQVAANPYSWPYNKRLSPNNTALLVIDMQNDFLSPGGYIAQMGYDVSNSRKTIAPVLRLVTKMRERGFHIIWTREGHVKNLSDCYPVKYFRSRNTADVGIGDTTGVGGRVLVRGEEGFDIVPEFGEIPPYEVIIDKLGKGSFVETQLETVLRTQGIQNLIFCGLTTDVCVHTTMREAGDRGFECLLVTDCTQSLERNVWSMAIRSVQLSGGIFGATCNSTTLIEALDKIPLNAAPTLRE